MGLLIFDVAPADASARSAPASALRRTRGRASGGGEIDDGLAEMEILRGNTAGGRAKLGFSVELTSSLPTGQLTFADHGAAKSLKSTSMDSFVIDPSGNSATFAGKATVDGTADVEFAVSVGDLDELGAGDTFTITWPGYLASGVLTKGTIEVRRDALHS
jgi:hypothetical protein